MRSLPGRAFFFSLFCCALFFFSSGESIGAESLRDRVAQFFGIEFRTLDEKEAKRFHERIAEGDREGADKVLKVYLRKAKKEYQKEGSPTPPVLSGRSSIYVPPWDRFLEHRIRDTKDENLTVLCDVIGNLFSDERKGEGYHLSGLVEMIGKKLEVRYKNDPGGFTGKFLDEYETLSPAGQALIMSGLMINLQEKKGFAYLRHMQRLVEARSNYPLISDCLNITGIIRESRNLYHHLEPDSSTWPLEEYDRQIMKIIGNKDIPVMIRASAANKLLFESGGLINCPQFAREIYDLNRALETDYTTPPVRWWRFHLHNQTALRCGDREILEMAAEHIVEWIDRQKLPPPPGFPPAVMGSNMLSESLKILSMADRDSEAREIAATFVNRHHRLDPDIFLALVEIGDLQRALKMLPGKGEKVISWRGEGLRPKLIERLPEFYEAINDPALQLQIEAGIPGLMRDAFGDYRPTEKGLLDREDLLTPLFEQMKKLDIEQQVVIMGGMSKHPTHIATFADQYESYQLNFPLIELYGGAVPGERAFFHRINSWTTRFIAAYYREDLDLCRQLTAELTELNKSQYRRECEGIISRIVSRINPIVLDQLVEEDGHDYKEAARFWKDFAIAISTMTRNADWTCRGRACAYARLLEVKEGNSQTFEQWLADIPAQKAERLRE
ncbi:MAG: hypothetical protein P1V20_06235 [Verrucomicrobiales bacterium]|nr:hypothetical protein [Verrucomicrobiales bacterium]